MIKFIINRYNCEDASCYKDLARLKGIKYLTWKDTKKLVVHDPVRNIINLKKVFSFFFLID